MANLEEKPKTLSVYGLMWLLVMFDLPVGTKAEVRRANQFRTGLQQIGFQMKQFSVYIRPCASLAQARNRAKRVKTMIPPKGEVTVFYITDRQFILAENYCGTNKTPNEESTRRDEKQLKLF